MYLLGTPLDDARNQRFAMLCLRACGVAEEYSAIDPTWVGLPGSAAEVERSFRGPLPYERQWRRGIPESPLHTARIYASAVMEHLRSLAWLVSNPGLIASSASTLDVVARAAVEAAARGWWLMESRISPQKRVARWACDHMYSSYEAERYVANLGIAKDHFDTAGIAPTLRKSKRMVCELGLAHSGARTGHPVVDGEPRPSNTRIVKDLMGDTGYRGQRGSPYALSSGSGHSTLFALLFRYEASRVTVGSTQMISVSVRQEHVDFPMTTALVAFVAMMRRAVRLLGWGHIAIDLFEERIHKMYR
jgi:hypothetical protein